MMSYLSDVIRFSKGVRNFILTESLLGLGIGSYSLLLNLHLLAMGLNAAQIGSISSAGTLVMGITAVPFGMLAGRFGRKRLLVLGLLFMAAGYAFFGAGRTLVMYYAAQSLQSVGLTMLITTEIQLLFSYSRSKKEETKAFSMLFAMFTLFSGAGTLLGGYLPEWVGSRNSPYDYSLYVSAGFILLASILRILLLPAENMERSADVAGAGTVDQTQDRRRKLRLPGRAVWIFCGLQLLSGATFAFLDPFLNIIVKYRMEWSDEATSLLLTFNGLSLFMGSFFMPFVLERWGIARTYRLAYGVTLAVSILLAAALPAGMFSAFLLIRGGSFMMLGNLISSHSMSAVREEDRNLFAGMRSVFRSVGASAATYIGGIVLAGKEYGLPFLLAAGALLISFVYHELWILPLLKGRLEEDKQEAPV